MARRDDGGPAFPKPDTVESKDCHRGDYPHVEEGSEGMSLRDWFAGHALSGILAFSRGEEDRLPKEKEASEWAYEYADAMLAERTKE